MAINAMIPLAGRGVQLPDFASDRLRITQNRALQQDIQQNAFKHQQEQETLNALRTMGMNPTQEQVRNVFAVNPQAGMAAQRMIHDQQKQQFEVAEAESRAKDAEIKRQDAQFKLQSDRLQRWANRIGSASDQFTYERAIDGALADGDITPDIAQQMRSARFDDPQTQLVIGQTKKQVQTEQQRLKAEYDANQEARAAEEAARKQREFDATIGGKTVDPATGLNPYQKAFLDAQAADRKAQAERAAAQLKETSQHNRNMEGLTARGQNMADARARDAKTDKPPTMAEGNAYGFYTRAANAEKDLRSVEGKISKYNLAQQGWMALAPYVAQPEDNKAYLTAQRQFTEARLRKDSGAAIPEHEFENDRRMYFPQPGDSGARIEQKRRARKVIIDALKKQSGNLAANEPDQFADIAPPKTGSVEDGYVFMGGDPGDSKNWKKAK